MSSGENHLLISSTGARSQANIDANSSFSTGVGNSRRLTNSIDSSKNGSS